MEKYSENLSNKLKELLEKIYDGEKGFEKASEHTNDIFLKKYFAKKSKERFDFAHELESELRMYSNYEENNSGSIAGAAHRTWMNLKAIFSVDDDASMLEEAITGEKAALKEYNEILDESLSLSTRSVLLKQKDVIEKDLKTITNLEDLKN